MVYVGTIWDRKSTVWGSEHYCQLCFHISCCWSMGHSAWVTALLAGFEPPQLIVMKVEAVGDILLVWRDEELKQEQDLKAHHLKV